MLIIVKQMQHTLNNIKKVLIELNPFYSSHHQNNHCWTYMSRGNILYSSNWSVLKNNNNMVNGATIEIGHASVDISLCLISHCFLLSPKNLLLWLSPPCWNPSPAVVVVAREQGPHRHPRMSICGGKTIVCVCVWAHAQKQIYPYSRVGMQPHLSPA
jgi:hypothetical protein